jgi:hypothetical protein
MTKNFFPPLSFAAVFGSGIRDPGSEIRDPGWVKIRIRDKHPGSATLAAPYYSLAPETHIRDTKKILGQVPHVQ